MNIEADLTGAVVQVHVAVGDRVDSGAVVVTLESMKMEVPIESPTAGTVEAVNVEAGQLVSEGDVVAVIS